MSEHDDNRPIDETSPTEEPGDSFELKPQADEPATATEESAQSPPPPLDLEAMTTSVHERLRQLIARAREVQKAAKQLRSRVDPIVHTRSAAMALVDEKKPRLRPLLDAVRKQSETAAEAIRKTTTDLDYELQLRDETLRGAMAVCAQFQTDVESPMEAWSRAMHQRHAELILCADAVGRWLQTVELRWMPTDSEGTGAIEENGRTTDAPTPQFDRGGALQ